MNVFVVYRFISLLQYYFDDFLERERPQWLLWFPVAMGTGIVIYFQLDEEPLYTTWLITSLILAVGSWFRRHYTVSFIVAAALMAVSVGITAAAYRTHYLATPMLHQPLAAHVIEGIVDKIEVMPYGKRALLTNLSIKELTLQNPPVTARITFRGNMIGDQDDKVLPGVRLRCKAMLMPPGEPVAPHAYDFRRRAFFDGIGAIGYAVQKPHITMIDKSDDLYQNFYDKIRALRHYITMALRQRIGGVEGEIASALITGERAGIPNHIRQQYADAGTAHILAISGMHLSIVAGLIFFIIRGGLSLIPSIALRFPIKKWAAVIAIISTGFYLILCSAPISAQRSFFMTSLILTGVIIDRSALSMRNLALAATFILLFLPESIMSPSFQLSFSAVIALIAGYELCRPLMTKLWRKRRSTWSKLMVYLAGVTISTILATMATTPFILNTFHRFTVHAIPANLITIPLNSFLIMPSLVLMLVLMPLGLDGWLHKPIAFMLKLMSSTAAYVSEWPGSVVLISIVPTATVVMITYGFLILAFLKTKVRYAGFVVMAVGLAVIPFRKFPDLYISGDGKALVMRTDDGNLWTPSLRGGRFARHNWAKMMGRDHIERLPYEGWIHKPAIDCQDPTYYYLNRYQIIMQPNTTIVRDLQTNEVIVDTAILQTYGGMVWWLQDNKPYFKAVRSPYTGRPWSLLN